MKITVEIDSVEELQQLLSWRDELRDRIHQLEAEPLAFSLRSLADNVSDGMQGLTPDQYQQLRRLIEGTET